MNEFELPEVANQTSIHMWVIPQLLNDACTRARNEKQQ